MSADLLTKFKERGLDTSWYRKGAQTPPKPLTAPACSWFSIYLVKDGKVWTKDHSGRPYQAVRDIPNYSGSIYYVCSHCRIEWSDYAVALAHIGQ